MTRCHHHHHHLRVVEVLALVAEPPRQLMHHLLEDHAVHVLAKHVEQKPVPHLQTVKYQVSER